MRSGPAAPALSARPILRPFRRRVTEVSPQPLTIGRQSFPDNPEKAARADLYLRENVKYALGEREIAGLRRFYELAAEVGALPSAETPRFYGQG